jgi:drug/metabolite transporter (DMT)-like permease
MVSAGIAAVMWGGSDFIAGVLARRLRVATVLICSKAFGMAMALPVVAVRDMPSSQDTRLAMVAGFIGLPAMGLLYRAMRDGSLIVVAPVAAAAALVPVGWGLLGGERFGAAGRLGVAVALIGVTLASWPVTAGQQAGARPSTMLSALGAALGFGTYFVLLHKASNTDPYVVIAISHICGGAAALVLAGALLLRRNAGLVIRGNGGQAPLLRRPRRPALAAIPIVAMCGVGALDVAGDAAFLVAAHGGPLGQAAVLASLYPAVTVLLNRSVLRERMHAVHLCGVLAALFAVACLAS